MQRWSRHNALITGEEPLSLRARLGQRVGPARDPAIIEAEKELP